MSAEITVLYRQYIEAWNAHDGDRMAATFADDGEMIGLDGNQVPGRSNIAAERNQIFADHETASFVAKVKGVRSADS